MPGTTKAARQLECRDESRGNARRERGTEIAADAIERQRPAPRAGLLDRHRRADGMVDRRKNAQREQRAGKRNQVGASPAASNEAPQPA